MYHPSYRIITENIRYNWSGEKCLFIKVKGGVLHPIQQPDLLVKVFKAV